MTRHRATGFRACECCDLRHALLHAAGAHLQLRVVVLLTVNTLQRDVNKS